MGYEHGQGTTHLSIALANYTAKWLGAGTALVEFGERNALAQLGMNGNAEGFCIDGVDYYPSTTSSELGYIYNRDYEYIIIDLGTDSRQARKELMRCNGKLVVGSLCPWRKASFYDYINRILQDTGGLDIYTFLALFEDKIEIKRCRRTFKAQVKSIPFIADPFCIGEKEIPFLHSLI